MLYRKLFCLICAGFLLRKLLRKKDHQLCTELCAKLCALLIKNGLDDLHKAVRKNRMNLDPALYRLYAE
jgi:hypothetical protein